MKRRCIVAACVAMTVASIAAAKFDVANPPMGVFDDNYYAVELQGSKCGYARMASKREGDEIVSLTFMKIEIARGAVAVNIVVKSVHRETLDGRALGFEAEQFTSLMTIKLSGQIRDGKVTVTSSQGGQESVETYPWNPKGMLSWATVLEMERHGLTPGTEYDILSYDPLVRLESPASTHVKIVGPETVDVLGSRAEAIRVDTVTDVGMNLPSTSWVTTDGTSLITAMDMGMFKLRLVRCPKAYALQDQDAPELFVSTLIRADKPVRSDAKRIVYRLSMGKDADGLEFPETAMQHVVRRDGQSVELAVTRGGAPRGSAILGDPAKQDVAAYLASTLYLKHDDPLIRKMAAEARGRSTDAYEVAGKLREYVSREIRVKDLSVGFATASEVATSRQGDCTEHAVLLAAMARACEIPSRVVVGLVHVDHAAGQRDVFGYHMWTQVFISGQWVDLDAAMRQTQCDPTHIALDMSDLSQVSMADLAIRFLPMIGQLKIEVVEEEGVK